MGNGESLHNAEGGVLPGFFFEVDALNIFDLGVLRSLPQEHFKIGQGFRVTLRNALYAPVFQITDESSKGEVLGMIEDVASEADALNVSGDDELYGGHGEMQGDQRFLLTIETVA